MPRRKVRIGNRRSGALWWRVLVAAILWIPIASAHVVAIAGVVAYARFADGLPDVPDLDRFERTAPRTSRIVAADGTLLAEIPFTVGEEAGHRDWVAFGELPRDLVHAILAAEDARFFAHRGVDLRAVARAAWVNWRAGRAVEGASTITQQVARNLLPEEIGKERTARRKIREMILARRIEREWDKRTIFESYANLVFLGAGAYGVAAGARAYFDAPLASLDVAEHALLAGLIQAPGRLDPYKDPEAARERRDEILDRMRRIGFLDEVAHGAARARPLALRRPVDRYGTLAPWMTEAARRAAKVLDPVGFARGGWIIETSVLPVSSLEAEYQAVAGAARLARRQRGPAPQVGVFALDHVTGYVEVIAGGLDWDASRFDRATQACRQPGSAFKPLVYAAAIERDAITPGTPLRDAPVTEYDEDRGVYWKPSTAGHDFRGVALAQDALAASLNAPAIDVLDRVGVAPVVDLARRLGITTELDPVRPLVLGSSCAIPAELASAYATFARGGAGARPTVIVRVRGEGGVVVDRASPYDPFVDPARRLDRFAANVDRAAPALDARTAFLISSMLAEVVRAGTGRDARAIGRPAAGKTGTTNGNTDAWFVGFTARVTAAVWVGHDDPATPLGPREDGRRAALPIWVSIVRAVEDDRPAQSIPGPPPEGIVVARVDRETGLLARPGAGGAVDLFFKEGSAPTEILDRVRDVPRELDQMSRQF